MRKTIFLYSLAIITVLTSLSSNRLLAGKYIGHVTVRYEEAMTFKRICEYFTNKENQGFRVITRTNDESREGMYWVLTLNRLVSEIPAGSKLELQYYVLGDTKLKTQTFDIDTKRNSTAIYAGVTGGDWPDPKQTATAWKVEIQDESGRVLESRKSYLWEQP